MRLRLQKAFLALADLGDPDLAAALTQSRLAMERAETAIAFEADEVPPREAAEAFAAAGR